mgnify:CR=1 FL=1
MARVMKVLGVGRKPHIASVHRHAMLVGQGVKYGCL